MRAPLSWLREFAQFPNDIRVLTAALDDLGLVVEEVEQVGQGLESIVVSEVTEVALSTDGGRNWIDAKFLDPVQRYAWRRWTCDWLTPKRSAYSSGVSQ